MIKVVFGSAAVLMIPSGQAGNDQFRKFLEESFVASIVLTDSDALRFGIHDFDPNAFDIIDDENIGSEDSLKLRSQISTLTIPFTIELDSEDEKPTHWLKSQFSFVQNKQDVEIVGSTGKPDYLRESTLSLMSEYVRQYELSERWKLKTGLGAHLIYYENKYRHHGADSISIRSRIDSGVYNTSAWALVSEPTLEFEYVSPKDWGRWEFSSKLSYMYGTGWGDANEGDVGNPEALAYINDIKLFYDYTEYGGMVQSLFAQAKRVDLGGDVVRPMGAGHYYEVAGGWLISPPFESTIIENIGIGLSVNYGSSLKGGSIVFYFNQE